MPDTPIPADIVAAAARKLREGEHLIGEVLAQVLTDLRAAGWFVAPDLMGVNRLVNTRYAADRAVLVMWPIELSVPFFEGDAGARTIAPWSVKLTPEPYAGLPTAPALVTHVRFGDPAPLGEAYIVVAAEQYEKWRKATGQTPQQTIREHRIRTEMRPQPSDWYPKAVHKDDGKTVMFMPPDGSLCRPVGYQKTDSPNRNLRLMEAALDSLWQALEHERITGEPPTIDPPPAAETGLTPGEDQR